MQYGKLLTAALLLLESTSATPVAASRDTPKTLPQKKGRHLRPYYEYEKRDAPQFEKRQSAQFANGQPIDGTGKGAPFSGSGTNKQLDLQNPDNLGRQSTDNGVVVNLKWSFSDSKTRLLNGGWVREQVVTDLPPSKDIAAAQQHLTKGSSRELHWHRVAEWGYIFSGQIRVSAVDEDGRNQIDTLGVGDIWYFPKGQAHTLQGLADENEYLLVFDDGNFDAVGTTFNLDDWIAHTPKDILAKNFGVDASVFANVPAANPYIYKGNVSTQTAASPVGALEGNSSYVYKLSQKAKPLVPGGGGTLSIVDSRNFPVSTTLAAAIVTLQPGALRELHWHPNADEWLYFAQGTAQATVFVGGATARTFDFSAGDTAVFPDNTGHYVLNTSKNETLVWIELYKSDRAADISLTQWLALTPADVVAATLKVDISFVNNLKKVKQLIVK